ncbi:prefoldin subunit alpha [Candidatus Woesearchaeota archaeon]|nr:prefoldin subunit alpha [Candidatus Woesearchaeota archaeon]
MAAKKIVKKIEAKDNDAKKEFEQNKYVQLQLIDQQARQLQQYLHTFDQQLLEIRSVINSINELAKLKKGDTILAPIANGIFIKAKLEDNKEVRMNVGNNTVVNKSTEDAIKMLQSQEAEVTQYRSEVIAKLDELIKQAEELQK